MMRLLLLLTVLLPSALLGKNEPLTLKYAQNFSVEYTDAGKLLTVRNPWPGGEEIELKYLLVRENFDAETVPKSIPRIRIPAKRVAIGVTNFLPHFLALGHADDIIGVTDPKLINSTEIIERIESGQIKAVGHSATLNLEVIINEQPDVVITSSLADPKYDNHHKLMNANIPLVLTAGYMEATPLARAEWIKFIALFLDEEEKAKRIFNEIESEYNALQKLAEDVEVKPKVVVNVPWSGTWYVPGGQGFQAQLIADAGGHYAWANNDSRASLPLNFEAVFAQAVDADFWLNTRQFHTLKDLLQEDARYAFFAPMQKNNVYNNSKRTTPGGGNDVWERGVLYPQEILADLIHIFHPQKLPDHKLVFYQKVQ